MGGGIFKDYFITGMRKLLLTILSICVYSTISAQQIGEIQQCMACNGQGKTICPYCNYGVIYTPFGRSRCPVCYGTIFQPCYRCLATGFLTWNGEKWVAYVPTAPTAPMPQPFPMPQSSYTPDPGSSSVVQKMCPYCSGKGETIQHEYVATFGLDGPSTYCAKCGQSWSHGTVHAHHTCNHCNGTGYITY